MRHLPFFCLHLVPIRLGRLDVFFQSINHGLVMGCHVLQQCHSGGEFRKALGIQKYFQGAHIACGVKDHQARLELVDSILYRLQGLVQLQGQFLNTGVQVIDILPGGQNLFLDHVDLLLQGILIFLLLGFILPQAVQLGLQLLVL